MTNPFDYTQERMNQDLSEWCTTNNYAYVVVSNREINAISALYREGTFIPVIARAFNMSPEAIQAIVEGRVVSPLGDCAEWPTKLSKHIEDCEQANLREHVSFLIAKYLHINTGKQDPKVYEAIHSLIEAQINTINLALSLADQREEAIKRIARCIDLLQNVRRAINIQWR